MAAPNIVASTPISFSHLTLIQVALTPAAAGAATATEQTFTVTGLSLGDGVINGADQILSIRKAAAQTGLSLYARVSATDTLAITFINPTAGSITPTAGELYTLCVWRPCMMPAATATLV